MCLEVLQKHDMFFVFDHRPFRFPVVSCSQTPQTPPNHRKHWKHRKHPEPSGAQLFLLAASPRRRGQVRVDVADLEQQSRSFLEDETTQTTQTTQTTRRPRARARGRPGDDREMVSWRRRCEAQLLGAEAGCGKPGPESRYGPGMERKGSFEDRTCDGLRRWLRVMEAYGGGLEWM